MHRFDFMNEEVNKNDENANNIDWNEYIGVDSSDVEDED